MELLSKNISTEVLDHHGLVAAKCKDLNLSDVIDLRLGKQDSRRIVSTGKACVAMILNGLGFTNRRLYLTPQFFENKPVDLLLGEGIEARHLNDDCLGDALDAISEYGASKLFGEVAFEIAQKEDLLNNVYHVDTTSFSLHGQYNNVQDEPSTIEVTQGYSKANRPDLKQVILSLVVNGKSGVPLWMQPCDGNASDRVTLPETIERVEAFCKNIDLGGKFKWIADSALYSAERLLKHNDYLWLCRVPEIVKEAKDLVHKHKDTIEWQVYNDGYSTFGTTSEYGGVKQRWVLIFSQQAYAREKITFEKRLKKQAAELEKSLWHLKAQTFGCSADALSQLTDLQKKYPCFIIKHTIELLEKFDKKGRPKLGDAKKIVGYQIVGTYENNQEKIDEKLHAKGRFILATNDLNTTDYPDSLILEEYKQQQKVENGFRFLKDPWFMVDSIFLKSPKRIEALMMVMTLCLFIYQISQYELRKLLIEQNKTLPNQAGKEIQNPTMRWVFQIMEGIAVVKIQDSSAHVCHKFISNITDVRRKIITLFGSNACIIYGFA